ncbi:hypothetical protein RJD24_11510 [Bacillaceae bacterium IKA-2]|nr:hypothetical protein RJD24_11510 [Bacillaceae bacterium IKA-2]
MSYFYSSIKLVENTKRQKEKIEKRKEEDKRKKEEKRKKDKPKLIITGILLVVLFLFLGVMSFFEDDESKEVDTKNQTEEKRDTDKLAKEEEREKREVDKLVKEKERENEVIKSIYDDAVGELAYDIFKDLDKEGFEAEFIHATSRQDFTTVVQFESDSEDEETYIPWVITELNSFDSDEKYASFYINTEENMDADTKNLKNEKKLTDKLSPSFAWGAVSMYGKHEFPYGFKLKVSKMLAEEAIDEKTWFLKTNCHIKNSSGVWNENAICEAEVTGTNEAPNVISFNVYNPGKP